MFQERYKKYKGIVENKAHLFFLKKSGYFVVRHSIEIAKLIKRYQKIFLNLSEYFNGINANITLRIMHSQKSTTLMW